MDISHLALRLNLVIIANVIVRFAKNQANIVTVINLYLGVRSTAQPRATKEAGDGIM